MDNIKRQIIQLVNDDKYTPMTLTEIVIKLELNNDMELRKLIKELLHLN